MAEPCTAAASRSLITALLEQALSPHAFARIIAATSRKAVAAYFESSRGYIGFRSSVHMSALACVGSFLRSVPDVAAEIAFLEEGGLGNWASDHSGERTYHH